MSDKQTENKKVTSKEIMHKEIADKLSETFPNLKESLGDKKFEKRIKKAAKLLSEGIKPNGTEKKPATKAIQAKPAPKKAKVAAAKKVTKTVAAK